MGCHFPTNCGTKFRLGVLVRRTAGPGWLTGPYKPVRTFTSHVLPCIVRLSPYDIHILFLFSIPLIELNVVC